MAGDERSENPESLEVTPAGPPLSCVPGHPAAVYELYDFQTDPLEKKKLAGEAELHALFKELAAQFEAGWRAAGLD